MRNLRRAGVKLDVLSHRSPTENFCDCESAKLSSPSRSATQAGNVQILEQFAFPILEQLRGVYIMLAPLTLVVSIDTTYSHHLPFVKTHHRSQQARLSPGRYVRLYRSGLLLWSFTIHSP